MTFIHRTHSRVLCALLLRLHQREHPCVRDDLYLSDLDYRPKDYLSATLEPLKHDMQTSTVSRAHLIPARHIQREAKKPTQVTVSITRQQPRGHQFEFHEPKLAPQAPEVDAAKLATVKAN